MFAPRVLFAAALGISVCSLAAPAMAAPGGESEQRARARKLGYSGIDAYQAGDFPTAAARLDRAFRLLPVPSLGLWSARALVQVGKLVEAARRYREVSGLPLTTGEVDVQKKSRREAVAGLEALLPLVPRLVLQVEGAPLSELRVRLDGEPLSPARLAGPIHVNPGEHQIEAEWGSELQAARVTAATRVETPVPLRFVGAPARDAASAVSEPTPLDGSTSTSDDAWRTTGWAALGVGSGALVVSAVLGIVAKVKQGDMDCSGDKCVSDNQSDVDTYNALRGWSTGGYLVGGVLAGAGGLLLWQLDDGDESLSVGLGPGSATLSGRF